MKKASNKPKFKIGQTVYNTVSCIGSYEPSRCGKYEKLKISKIEQQGDTFVYTCDYDGYKFKENELITRAEYKRMI